MGEPNRGRQGYLATCSHRPSDLSCPVRPRIPRARTLHHIHESSPCCCCAALPPADTYRTHRKSELSVPAPSTANTDLLATCISGTQKYPTGSLHTSCQHRHFEKLSENKIGNFNSYSRSIWIPFPEWRMLTWVLSRGSHPWEKGPAFVTAAVLLACFPKLISSSLFTRLDSNPPIKWNLTCSSDV